jgi:urease accessory protein
MWPVALGAVAADAGLGPVDAAVAAAHAAVSGPAWAAVRLLGLDPIAVATVLAALAPMIDRQAGQLSAGTEAGGPAAWSSLPADGGPVVDVAAQAHAGWEVRLFAS